MPHRQEKKKLSVKLKLKSIKQCNMTYVLKFLFNYRKVKETREGRQNEKGYFKITADRIFFTY